MVLHDEVLRVVTRGPAGGAAHAFEFRLALLALRRAERDIEVVEDAEEFIHRLGAGGGGARAFGERHGTHETRGRREVPGRPIIPLPPPSGAKFMSSIFFVGSATAE